MDFIIQNFQEFLTYTGFANATAGNLIMILVGIVCIWLAIKKDFEPLLLVPIGLGIILGNIPFRTDAGLEIGLTKTTRCSTSSIRVCDKAGIPHSSSSASEP